MGKFRKKPVVIEAFQLNERGLIEEDWFWDAVTRNDIITHCFGKHYPDPAWCEIKTLEGTMIANAGDYIIQGVNGEIYPCKADIFQKTYTEDNTKTNADCIRYMDAADVAPVIHAHWISASKKQGVNIGMKCSLCGARIKNSEFFNGNHNYCHKCGAKMDEKEDR